ncbi:MAG: AlkA N-terminal domain-containing protein, partial [Pyrinomonadaceae bacterium]
FYSSAAAAERAGFRPCLRCRPELAPGRAPIDAVSRLAALAASRIEDGVLTDRNVCDLATEMGISDRHLRRVIEREFGVSPIELAQTQRLLLAKHLLTDTNLPITEVAFASGFSSVRRFNALFRERYRLNPTKLRKSRATEIPHETLLCELAYRPPLDWDSLLSFLIGRATYGVENIDGHRYMRTVLHGKHCGWIAVEPSKNKPTIRVEVSVSLAPVLLPILARVKRLFDLAAEPQQIATHLGSLSTTNPGLRVPGAFDGFELAVRAILGQQVSVKAATTFANRFAIAFGDPIKTPSEKLTHLTPTAGRIACAEAEEIAAIGIVAARANAILALARAVVRKRVTLDPGAEVGANVIDVEETMARLKELPGIGEWTVQYIAMRALSWPDAFPHTDLGICKALGESSPKRVLQIAEAWRPWRSYAAMYLWKSLETNNDLLHLFRESNSAASAHFGRNITHRPLHGRTKIRRGGEL